MIFCTLCYGDYFAKKYSPDINKISENHSIYVYTNKPEYFKSSCNIIEYKRKDFSYFEKMVLIFNVMDKCKERVTYFDSDSIDTEQVQSMLNGTNRKFEDETIYTYKIHNNTGFTVKVISRNPSLVVLMKVYKELGFEHIICDYTHERILSVPYIPNKFQRLKEGVLSVQSIWEENWPKGKKWEGYPEDETGTHENNKWSQFGCGYGEGGALSLYAKKLGIKLGRIVSVNKLI